MHTIRFVLGSLFAGLPCVSAQTYTFTTLAGTPSAGNADGMGAAARFFAPQDVAVDGDGNVFVADSANHTIRKITTTGIVTTLAGAAGEPGSADGIGSAARFRRPTGVAIDGAGNVYVAEQNHTIRKISPAAVVTTFAGAAGQSGSVDGAGSAARFNLPSDVAVDPQGNMYVADTDNHTIRKITGSGEVTTLAGHAGQQGSADSSGDAARFSFPGRLAVDSGGNVFVADGNHNHVRKVTPAGVVTTLAADVYPAAVAVDRAGNVYVANNDPYEFTSLGLIDKITSGGVLTVLAGTNQNGSEDGRGDAARFSINLGGLAVDGSGNVFVADSANNTIRKITPDGVVTTLAGAAPGIADGIGSAARFRYPSGVAVDRAGNVYVTDDYTTIRKITAEGVVSTLAGSAGNFGRTDGPGSAARFSYPQDVAVNDSGNVYVADGGNRTIRKVTAEGVVTTLAGAAGLAGSVDANGSEARFNFPGSIAVDGTGIYVADFSTIRKVTANGDVTTLAGTAGERGTVDGIGSAARFGDSLDVAVDGRGNVFVADYTNSTIRKVTPDGIVTTMAGAAGRIGSAIDGPGSVARFYYPRNIAVDSAGSVFVVDTNNHRIRKITEGIVTTLKTTLPYIEFPSQLAVDAAGNLYLSDIRSHTILKGVSVFTTESDTRLTNLSVRANLQTQQPLIAGFDLRGSKPVLLRAVGPGLQPFLPGVALASDPRLDVYDHSGALVASNENWGGGTALREAFAAAGAFPLDFGSTDAAWLGTMNGQSTVHVSTVTNGIGLFEWFDLAPSNESRIANLSARHRIGNDPDGSFVVGFTIMGSVQKTVLIRGIGPGLAAAPFNIAGTITDPTLTVFNQGGHHVAENDNWSPILASDFARVGAFPLKAGSKDAALLLTLSPGVYSAIVSGVGGASGEAMIEIYDVQ